MKQKAEKVNLVETPQSWDEIVTFCLGASTPSDASIAALMAWNFCVEFHHSNDECCNELRKIRSEAAERLRMQDEWVDTVNEENNDGC